MMITPADGSAGHGSPDQGAPNPRDADATVQRLRAAGCVFAEDEAALLSEAAADLDDLDRLTALRVQGQPLEHLLGWVDFGGLRLRVGPGVFVPRQRTTLLATAAADLTAPGSVVVEMCCGCGAVGAVIAAAVPDIDLHLADIDPVAIGFAARNLPGAALHCGDLYQALPAGIRGRTNVLVANAPYVPSDAVALMPPEARDHEPRIALDGGVDGLSLQRALIAGAPAWLAPRGHLLVETGASQVALTRSLMESAGLSTRVMSDPEVGATVVVGRRGHHVRTGTRADLPSDQ